MALLTRDVHQCEEAEEEAEAEKTAPLQVRISAVQGKTKPDTFLTSSMDAIRPTSPAVETWCRVESSLAW